MSTNDDDRILEQLDRDTFAFPSCGPQQAGTTWTDPEYGVIWLCHQIDGLHEADGWAWQSISTADPDLAG